jgi:excisionase family DNA binding protein
MTIEVYTVKEASEVLKVSAATVYRLVREGEIRHTTVGQRIMFRTQDIEDYINRGDGKEDQ